MRSTYVIFIGVLGCICIFIMFFYYFYLSQKDTECRKSWEEFADHRDIPEQLSQVIKHLAKKISNYKKGFLIRKMIGNAGIAAGIVCASYCIVYIIEQINHKEEINPWIPGTSIIMAVLLAAIYYYVKDMRVGCESAYKICEDQMKEALFDAKTYIVWRDELEEKKQQLGNEENEQKEEKDRAILNLEDRNLGLFIDNTINDVEKTIEKTDTGIANREVSFTKQRKMRRLPRIKTLIITALPEEYTAVNALLNKSRKKTIKIKASTSDDNTEMDITVGTIKGLDGREHNIGLFELTQSGNTDSAVYTTSLINHLPRLELVIMCGIAGGVPKAVKLGDVVVSTSGIFQYDYGNDNGGSFISKDKGRTCDEMTRAINNFQSYEMKNGSHWRNNIEKIQQNTAKGFLDHPQVEFFCEKDSTGQYVPEKRIRPTPIVPDDHYGIIASGNSVQRDAEKRDRLYDERQVLAIEMEGAGVREAASFYKKKFVVVRGISDFCDKAKNDDWHKYASATAASYTIGLLQTMEKI